MNPKDPLGATPIAEEDREGLIPKHVTTRDELNACEFANINKASLKYFAGKLTDKKAPFTLDWLKGLHREMFEEVWRWAGEFRTKDLSIGVPVHQIREQMKQLEGEIKSWEQFQHEVLERAVKLHHRLVWIHPFRNGNGRWARFATNVYLSLHGKPGIAWPENEFFIESTFRKKYIEALQKADKNDFVKLTQIHSELQK